MLPPPIYFPIQSKTKPFKPDLSPHDLSVLRKISSSNQFKPEQKNVNTLETPKNWQPRQACKERISTIEWLCKLLQSQTNCTLIWVTVKTPSNFSHGQIKGPTKQRPGLMFHSFVLPYSHYARDIQKTNQINSTALKWKKKQSLTAWKPRGDCSVGFAQVP